MIEDTNQYAVYRLRRDMKETRAFRHQSYQYLQEHGLKVISDYYNQLFLAGFDPSMTRTDLRRQLEKELPTDSTGQTLDISDVLAITRSGITSAYYVDPDKLVSLTGFFHIAETSETIITIDTSDYRIEGRNGLWFVVEEIWIDGQNFFLMQSQKYGTNAAYAVLDKHGRQAAEDTTKGFTEEIIRQIRKFVLQPNNNDLQNDFVDNKRNGKKHLVINQENHLKNELNMTFSTKEVFFDLTNEVSDEFEDAILLSVPNTSIQRIKDQLATNQYLEMIQKTQREKKHRRKKKCSVLKRLHAYQHKISVKR